MKRNVIYVFLICVCLNGCRGRTDTIIYQYPVFDKNYRVKTTILNEDFLFKFASEILIADSLLILIDRSMESMIHFFDKNSGTFLMSTGVRGEGPGELIDPNAIILDENKKNLYMNDFTKKKIIRYNLPDIVQGKKDFYEEISLEDPVRDFSWIYYLKDSLYLTYGSMHSHANIISTKETLLTHNGPPFGYPFESQKEWNSFWWGFSVKSINPSKNKYVIGSAFGGVMQLFDINKKLELYKTCYFYPIDVQNREVNFTPHDNTIFGFFHITSSDDYIYTTFFGEKDPVETPKSIMQFDWEGRPVAHYETEYNIEKLAVEETTNTLYAAVYKGGELVLAVIDLNDKEEFK